MLKTLETDSLLISLEAVKPGIGIESASQMLPPFIKSVQAFYKEHIGSPIEQLFAGAIPQTFNKAIKDRPYTTFKDVTVFVPPGLQIPLLEYGQLLDRAIDLTVRSEADIFDPFIKWAGEKMGQPSAMASKISSLKLPEPIKEEMTKLEEAIQNAIASKGRKETEVTYFKAVSRQSDWETLTRLAAEMEKKLSPELHKRLVSKLEHLDSLLSSWIIRVGNDPDVYKPSAVVLSDLTDAAFTTARVMEFYGLTQYRVKEFTTAINDSIAKLKEFVA